MASALPALVVALWLGVTLLFALYACVTMHKYNEVVITPVTIAASLLIAAYLYFPADTREFPMASILSLVTTIAVVYSILTSLRIRFTRPSQSE